MPVGLSHVVLVRGMDEWITLNVNSVWIKGKFDELERVSNSSLGNSILNPWTTVDLKSTTFHTIKLAAKASPCTVQSLVNVVCIAIQ